jgi:hypothetical protein
MKSIHRCALSVASAAFFIACSPAVAQWQAPDHSVPIGRGVGATGFKSTSPGTAGQVLTSNGPSADPTFQPKTVVDPADVQFGGDCTGATDSTTAVTNAIAALGSGGGEVRIRNGCLLKIGGSGAQIFLITTPIRFTCPLASSSGFVVTAATSATTDIFRLAPPSNTTIFGAGMSGCQVIAISGTPGRHVWNFDTTPGTTTTIAEFLASDNVFGTFGNYTFFNNTGAGTTSGGIFTSNFFRNVCSGSGSSTAGGCFGGLSWGDSNHIYGGQMAGNGYAVNISLFSGAGNLVIEKANIVSSSMVKIDGGYNVVIRDNTFEQQGFINTETNNAILDLNGAVTAVINPIVTGNQIVAGAGLGNPTPIRISNATTAVIDHNRISVPSNYPAISISAPASDTRIGCMNQINGASPAYLNSAATGTQFCASPTVISSNVNFNSVADTAIPITVFAPRWIITSVEITACTGSVITAAHFGVFTSTGGGGTAIVTNTVGTITTGGDNSANNTQLLSPATGFTQSFNLSQIYFRVITAQGSAASCNVNVVLLQLP